MKGVKLIKMPFKTTNCRLCNATFVPENTGQVYCNNCLFTLDLDEEELKVRHKILLEDRILQKKFEKI